ncbi:MAG TPA: DinB family protein [Candidatus Acidoferrales bacterium]|nr:DinB family protein [Candidatus Acidoferrales bacterium]
MKPTILAFLVFIAAGNLPAQNKTPQGLTPQPNQTDSALTAQTRHVFQSISANTLKAAREMPEKSYSFRPTSDVRTFGELVAHIADVQTALCSNINGQPEKIVAQTSKEGLIKDLVHSAVECQSAFDELSAQNENTLVQTPTGQLTHLAALIYILTHGSEEYGQMGIYLRLNHLEPPTSDEPKKTASERRSPRRTVA